MDSREVLEQDVAFAMGWKPLNSEDRVMRWDTGRRFNLYNRKEPELLTSFRPASDPADAMRLLAHINSRKQYPQDPESPTWKTGYDTSGGTVWITTANGTFTEKLSETLLPMYPLCVAFLRAVRMEKE